MSRITHCTRCLFSFFVEPKNKITNKSLLKLRNVLRNFGIRFIQEDGSEVKPYTMLKYLHSLQSALTYWDYDIDPFHQPLFLDKKEGLETALENLFADRQCRGMTVKHQTNLLKEELILLLDQAVCDSRTSVANMYRDILVLDILLGIRPSATWELTRGQFREDTVKGQKTHICTIRIGSRTVASKEKKRGMRSIYRQPVQILLRYVNLVQAS